MLHDVGSKLTVYDYGCIISYATGHQTFGLLEKSKTSNRCKIQDGGVHEAWTNTQTYVNNMSTAR